MRRRDAIAVLGCAVVWPRRGSAQEPKTAVVGYLNLGALGPAARMAAGFRQGLSETGYVEGKNLKIEDRWAEGHYDRLQALADDLAGRGVDVIATSGGRLAARAAKNASETIPIVFATGSDPIED